MKHFTSFLKESDERAKASIDSFLGKIYNCKTAEGIDELEALYKKRKEEVNISDSDDITVRDALRGRRDELTTPTDDDEPEAEEL